MPNRTKGMTTKKACLLGNVCVFAGVFLLLCWVILDWRFAVLFSWTSSTFLWIFCISFNWPLRRKKCEQSIGTPQVFGSGATNSSVSNRKLATSMEARQVSRNRSREWIINPFTEGLWGNFSFHLFYLVGVFGSVLLYPSQASSVDSCRSSCWSAERLQSPNSAALYAHPLMGWQWGAHWDMPRLVPNCSFGGSNPP